MARFSSGATPASERQPEWHQEDVCQWILLLTEEPEGPDQEQRQSAEVLHTDDLHDPFYKTSSLPQAAS